MFKNVIFARISPVKSFTPLPAPTLKSTYLYVCSRSVPHEIQVCGFQHLNPFAHLFLNDLEVVFLLRGDQ
ncbi:hypothetical protein SAMN06269250_0081 [Spirosoma fluviale]|uniref:Uncharacterized protein n=1 Tax=Spirosoma fluviale TaxID=1597977 RepID=A0A286GWS8_9BACT|nr:hypothetical protein SAMN06269250_0081 [Spirosoma fluviale]